MINKARKSRPLPLILLSFSVSLLGVGAFALMQGIRKGAPRKPRKVMRDVEIRKPLAPRDVSPPPAVDVAPPIEVPPPPAVDVAPPIEVPPPSAVDVAPPTPADVLPSLGFVVASSPQADVPPAFSVTLSPAGFYVVTPSPPAFDVPLSPPGFCVAPPPPPDVLPLPALHALAPIRRDLPSPARQELPPPARAAIPPPVRAAVLPPARAAIPPPARAAVLPPVGVDVPQPVRPPLRPPSPKKVVSQKARRSRYLPLIVLSVSVSLLGAGTFAMIRVMLSGGPGQPKKVVQEIHVIRPPPPPPDVPPPPPPPPEEKVDIPDPQQQQPDPTPSNEPPPSEQLGLDAEGSAGGDAFGLLGNRGGRELLASGGSVYAWYSSLVTGEIREQLSDNKELRKGSYKVTVQIWIRGDGRVDRARVVKSTGDPGRDRAIESAAASLRFSKPPPADLPQPIAIALAEHS